MDITLTEKAKKALISASQRDKPELLPFNENMSQKQQEIIVRELIHHRLAKAEYLNYSITPRGLELVRLLHTL